MCSSDLILRVVHIFHIIIYNYCSSDVSTNIFFIISQNLIQIHPCDSSFPLTSLLFERITDFSLTNLRLISLPRNLFSFFHTIRNSKFHFISNIFYFSSFKQKFILLRIFVIPVLYWETFFKLKECSMLLPSFIDCAMVLPLISPCDL